MKPSSLTKIKRLLRKVSFTAAEARELGVSPSLLSYYVNKGELERLSHGVYQGTGTERKEVPFEWEDLIATVESIPNGIVCLISALAIYELTEEIPRRHWIAIPHKQFAPKRPRVKIVRMRDTKVGSTRIKLGSVLIKIFDKEKTIIDAFRFLPSETAIKALKMYLSGKHGKADLAKLRRYSMKLKMPIEKYVEALTT
jgi:predicted transcriptional regulator of viral defense system